jgi:AcrR family transcriptional regulator
MAEQASPEPLRDTRSRILAAAISLFGEQGYAGTSVRDISERLGVTKAALYYHFPSKETILDALLEPLMSELARLVELVRQSPPPSPEVLIERLAEVMAGPGGVLLAFINDPSVIRRKIGGGDMLSLQHALVCAIAGPAPSSARLLRAHCAIGALKAGIMGRALERSGAADGSESADAPRMINSETLCALAVRGAQGLRPLVSAAERREIVAAALAALGGAEPSAAPAAWCPEDEESARRSGATGLCVESATSAALATPSVPAPGASSGARGTGITGIGGSNPPGYPPGVGHPPDDTAD